MRKHIILGKGRHIHKKHIHHALHTHHLAHRMTGSHKGHLAGTGRKRYAFGEGMRANPTAYPSLAMMHRSPHLKGSGHIKPLKFKM